MKSVFVGLTNEEAGDQPPPPAEPHPKIEIDIFDSVLGQLDNAADVSVTQLQHYLHGYRAFNETFKCPLVLAPANGAKITPKGMTRTTDPSASHLLLNPP